MLNGFYFTRGNAIIVENNATVGEVAPQQALATMLSEMLNYGYVPSQELYSELAKASTYTLAAILDEIIPEMQTASGSGESVTPMYPNFPNEVLEASEAELFVNAISHYLGDAIGYRIMPNIETKARPIRLDFPEAQVVELGTEEGLLRSLAMFLTMPITWGENEHRLLKMVFETRNPTALKVVSEHMSLMTNRENKAQIFADSARIKNDLTKELLVSPSNETSSFLEDVTGILVSSVDTYNTATDALRIAAVWSGFSPSLTPIKVSDQDSTRIKFTNIPNFLRRYMLSMVERDKDACVNVSRRPGLFKALGEKIHPGKYAHVYPRAAHAFNKVRNNEYFMPEAQLQKMFAAGDVKGAVAELMLSPGVFTRKLNQALVLAEQNDSVDYVLSEYKMVTSYVPSRLLWQAYKFFDDYLTKEVRATVPKSSAAAQYFIFAENKAVLSAATLHEAKKVLYAAIVDSYATKATLKGQSVFINPALNRIAIPGNLRDNTNLRYSMGRGSRMSIPEVNSESVDTVRLFMHWSDQGVSRVDLDLSAESYGANCEMLGSVWYGNLRDDYAVHSGDITSAPQGAAEYIDIDIKKAAAKGIRYVMASVTSFTGQPLDTVPEAYAGCMAISGNAQAGQIFDAKNVTSKFQLSSSARKVATIVLDIESREIILADISPRAREVSGNNVLSSYNATSQALRALLSQSIISVSDVATANVIARKGRIVTSKDDADIVFDYNDKGLSVPLDEILSEWL